MQAKETGRIRRRPGVLGLPGGVVGGDSGGCTISVWESWSLTWWSVWASLIVGRKYRCVVGTRCGSWIGISCHGRSSSPRVWASWWNAGVWSVLVEHGLCVWGTVSCTDGGAGCRFLFRGTVPLGRPEGEALSRELFRRPVKAHSDEKACVGSLL